MELNAVDCQFEPYSTAIYICKLATAAAPCGVAWDAVPSSNSH